MKTSLTLATLIVTAIVSASCGGGGSDTPTPAPAPTPAPTPTPAPAPAPTPQTFKIVAVGDSITQGDCARNSYRRALQQKLAADAELVADAISFDFVGRQTLNANFSTGVAECAPPNPDFDVQHEGFWGKRADEVAVNLQGLTVANAADIALIHLGSNDVFQFVGGNTAQTSDSTIVDITTVIARLRQVSPNVKILVAQIIPSTVAGAAAGISELNGKIALLPGQVGTTASPVIVVDQSSGFNAAVGVDTHDGTHPNPSGEDKIATRWSAAIKSAVR